MFEKVTSFPPVMSICKLEVGPKGGGKAPLAVNFGRRGHAKPVRDRSNFAIAEDDVVSVSVAIRGTVQIAAAVLKHALVRALHGQSRRKSRPCRPL